MYKGSIVTKRNDNSAAFVFIESPLVLSYRLSKHALVNLVYRFISCFSGAIAYAVKANPAPESVIAFAVCGIKA